MQKTDKIRQIFQKNNIELKICDNDFTYFFVNLTIKKNIIIKGGIIMESTTALKIEDYRNLKEQILVFKDIYNQYFGTDVDDLIFGDPKENYQHTHSQR